MMISGMSKQACRPDMVASKLAHDHSLLGVHGWRQLMQIGLVQVRYRPTAAGKRRSQPYQKSTGSASVG
jgi:hypothetical protein